MITCVDFLGGRKGTQINRQEGDKTKGESGWLQSYREKDQLSKPWVAEQHAMLQWKHHEQPQHRVRKLTWSPARGNGGGEDSSIALKAKHISLKSYTRAKGNFYLGSLIQLTYLPCLIDALAQGLSVYLTPHQVTKYTEDALHH